MKSKIISIILCLILDCNVLRANETMGGIIAAYYECWSQFYEGTGFRHPFSLKDVDVSLLTDLYFAFAEFGFEQDEVKIRPLYPDDIRILYPQLSELKKQSGGKLRLFFSIGGSRFNEPRNQNSMGQLTHTFFSKMASHFSYRQQFILSVIEYAHRYGFDGIDIDWEFPGDRKRGGSDVDFKNFFLLLKECSESFLQADPPILLSFCLPPAIPEGVFQSFEKDPQAYFRWASRCAEYADRVTLMTYNYHTPEGIDARTGVNAPLHRDVDPLSTLYIDYTLSSYLHNGLPASKVLLGIPLYGWRYQGVSGLSQNDAGPGKPFDPSKNENPEPLPYFEIIDGVAKKNYFFDTNVETSTAYGYDVNKKIWISFDTPQTVALKVDEARKQRLGGVIFWAINQDEYQWEPTFPNIRMASKKAADGNNWNH